MRDEEAEFHPTPPPSERMQRMEQRIRALEVQSVGLLGSIEALDKVTSILKRKFDVLDTSVTRLAEAAEKKGRKKS